MITNRVLHMLGEELNNAETQQFVRSKLIHPLIHIIYAELFPYLIVFSATIMVMFLLSLLTFMLFLLFYLRR